MQALEKCPLFRVLSAEEMVDLLSTTKSISAKKGEVIIRAGEPGSGMYIIDKGLVQVSAPVSDGKMQILTELGASDFFGEMAIVDDEPRSATVTAREPTELIFIPKASIKDLLATSPQFSLSLMRNISQRIREFNRIYIKEVLQAERLALVGRFARSIIHDIKNPLNIIGLSAELAGSPDASLNSRIGARQRISKQVERMTNMVNELLEFTRGEASSTLLGVVPFAAYVNQILNDIGQDLEDRKVSLKRENNPMDCKVLIDPRRLVHVFHNLINNAVDALGEEGGTVFIRFEKNEGNNQIYICIRDSGPGIAPEIASQLFEPFATFGKSKGTGLGLAICKKIIEDHKGSISASNAPEGGALFQFSLPVQADSV